MTKSYVKEHIYCLAFILWILRVWASAGLDQIAWNCQFRSIPIAFRFSLCSSEWITELETLKPSWFENTNKITNCSKKSIMVPVVYYWLLKYEIISSSSSKTPLHPIMGNIPFLVVSILHNPMQVLSRCCPRCMLHRLPTKLLADRWSKVLTELRPRTEYLKLFI